MINNDAATADRANTRPPWNGENGPVARLALVAVVAAIGTVVAHTLYVNRFRYDKMAFGLYYLWWKKFADGFDPWHAAPPCLYPPAFVIAFAPIARLGEPAAYWLWQSVQIIAFFAAVILIIREIGPFTIARTAAILAVVALLLPYFLSSTLYESEPTALLLLLLVAAWRFARHQRPGWAGLMLATATVLKVYPVVAGGYFLFRRRLKVVIWGATWTIAAVLATDPRRWINSLSHGAGPYFKSLAWASDGRAISIPLNVYAAFTRLLPHRDVPTAWLLAVSAILGLIVIAGAALTTWRAADITEIDGMAFALWMPVMLLLCPLTWNHEITLILPLYLFAAIYLIRCDVPTSRAAALLLAVAIAGNVIAYYSTPMRNRHADFIAVVIGYAAACAVIRYWSSTDRLRAFNRSISSTGLRFQARPSVRSIHERECR
jgi:hypothetical protein